MMTSTGALVARDMAKARCADRDGWRRSASTAFRLEQNKQSNLGAPGLGRRSRCASTWKEQDLKRVGHVKRRPQDLD